MTTATPYANDLDPIGRPLDRSISRPATDQPPFVAPYDLTGRRALVTGGGRGIGRAVARAFAEAGAQVGVIARSGDELAETIALIEQDGGSAVAAVADVTDRWSVAEAVDQVQRALGPIDVLVNNAGIIGPIGPLWDVDLDDWWATMDVNLRGLLLTTQLVLPGMIARRRGRVLNITSQAGAFRWPLVSAYSVSKAAVTKLTENLAHEARRHGISALSVHRGLLPIGMSEQVTRWAESSNPYELHISEWVERELAQGRGADPRAAIDLITRIASGGADELSGRHLSVHDDLDELLHQIADIRRRDLYVLHPQRS